MISTPMNESFLAFGKHRLAIVDARGNQAHSAIGEKF